MSISAATTFAQTILTYFSPAKSPYYSVIAFGGAAITLSAPIDQNWLIIFVPILLLLLYSTLLAVFDQPDFDEKEYDDQIKFARAFSLSTSVLCLVSIGLFIIPEQSENLPPTNSGYFWAAYCASMGQLVLFSVYAYVYANVKTKQVEKNFVQLALITSTHLIGLTFAVIAYHTEQDELYINEHYKYIFYSLYAFWLFTMLVWVNHLRKSVEFKFVKPEDAT